MIGTSIWLINYGIIPAAFVTLKLALSLLPAGIGAAFLSASTQSDLPLPQKFVISVASGLLFRMGLRVAIGGIGSAITSVASISLASLATRLTGLAAGYFVQKYYNDVPFARPIGIGEKIFSKLT